MVHPIVEAVLRHEAESPDHLAVCFKNDAIDYATLAFYMKASASLLQEKYKISERDIIMISAVSKPEFVVLWLAGLYLGATIVPVDKAMTPAKLSQFYDFVEPKCFFYSVKPDSERVNCVSLKEAYDSISCGNQSISAHECTALEQNHVSEIVFTTGTTGNPKGAMLSLHGITAITLNTVNGTNRSSDDIELLPLPLNHSFGLRVLRALLYVGATVVLQNGFMFLKETQSNITKYNCNGISAVPASMDRLMRNIDREAFVELFSGLKYVEISAGSLSVDSKIRILELLPDANIYNVWGSSETGGAIFLDIRRSMPHISSLGLPANNCKISFVSDDGSTIVADSAQNAGRMVISGPMCMSGYYKMPDETEKILKDDYLFTNDLAYKDKDGYVYMLGRVDDIINVGGEKVSPIEVENVCSMYEYVQECACIGAHDETGEFEYVPVLFVVTSSALFNEKDLIDKAKESLEAYKIPKKIIITEEIPKNSMKKTDRKALRSMLENECPVTNNPVINAIHSRRSVRKFTDESIPHDILESVVGCGICAPSGHNMRTWHFTVVVNERTICEMKEIIRRVAENKGVHFYGFENPKALILISNDRRNPDGIQDSSCAAQNIMLAAYSYGLGSVWLNPLMTICDEPEIRELLDGGGVPRDYNVWAMIALGYPAVSPSPLARREDVVTWVE